MTLFEVSAEHRIRGPQISAIQERPDGFVHARIDGVWYRTRYRVERIPGCVDRDGHKRLAIGLVVHWMRGEFARSEDGRP